MFNRLIRGLLGLGAVIVALVLALAAYMHFKPAPAPAITRPLAELLPTAPSGWIATELPIAESPEMQARVESILHYDDVASKLYEKGPVQVAVYAAHWDPGKFSPSKLAAHNPATCWVNSGWDMLSRSTATPDAVEADTLKPCQFGVFEKNAQQLHVVYWHLVGGVPMSYELIDWENGLTGRIQRIPTLWQDLRTYGLDQRREQVQVRVSSNVPMEQLWQDAGFQQLMAQLGRNLGLTAAPSPAGSGS